MVKSSGGQRESEGVVVPLIGVQHNAPGGKGPHFDHAGGEGKRQGMTGTARSNNPDGSSPVDPVRRLVLPGFGKVRELQRKLWAAAKQSSERRFHALYDRVHRGDVLWEAWRRVLSEPGCGRGGSDHPGRGGGVRGRADARRAPRDLRAGSYRPAPVRRVEIPKPDGGRRPLGIPTVRDRVAQQAAKLVLEPIFEADFTSVLVRVPAEAVGDAGDGAGP